jgi:hypothetical protein
LTEKRGTVTQRPPFAKKTLRASRWKNTEGTEKRKKQRRERRPPQKAAARKAYPKSTVRSDCATDNGRYEAGVTPRKASGLKA